MKTRHRWYKTTSKRKVLSHYKEGEAPVEFASTVEEHFRQFFLSQQKYYLHWKSAGNGNISHSFKSIAWKRFWSWTLVISSLFSSDLDKFKLETQIQTLKNIDKKQVGIKEAIKAFHH